MGIRKQLLALLFGVDVALIEKLERKLAKQAAKGGEGGKRSKKSKKKKSKKGHPPSASPLPATTPEAEAARIPARNASNESDKKGAP